MIAIQLPDGQMVHVDTTDPQQATQAGKRIWAQHQARADADKVTNQGQAGMLGRGPERVLQQAQTFGFGDEMAGGAAALKTLAGNTMARMQGKEPAYGVADAYHATVESERDAAKAWEQDHPKAASALGILGNFTPGGASIARTLPGMLRQGIAAGAGMGAVSGAGNAEGGVGSRLGGAAKGAIVGGAIGGAVPLAARGGATVARTGARLANRASGGRLLDPNREAASRLAEAMTADQLTPQQAQQAAQAWQATGASNPALMDVGGENTRALVRSAATQGPARQQAARYADTVVGDLQDNALRQTRALTPDQRPAQVVADELHATRQNQAATDYAPAYAEMVDVDPATASALRGEPGMAALRRARTAAVARRDDQQVSEIDQLLNGDQSSYPRVSAGTIDRIRIAMGGRAERMMQRPDTRDIGSGLQSRAADINTSLDSVPAIQPARANYRDLSQQIEAVDTGQGILNAAPDTFGAPPNAQAALGVGSRQALADAIGKPTEGATGVLNRIATSTNMGRNLETAFPGNSARYRQGISNEIDKVSNARFTDPRSGSKTASMLIDQADAIPTSLKGILVSGLDKLRRGATLTDGERMALVMLGQGDATAGVTAVQPAFNRTAPWASVLLGPSLAREGASQ